MGAVASADICLFEDFRLDRRTGVLFQRDQRGVFMPVAIGKRAFEILGLLVDHPGDLVSRDEIINVVWSGRMIEDGNLSVQISGLRRVLDNGRSEGTLIQTVAGRGYRFLGRVSRYDPEQLSLSPDHCADADADFPQGSLPIVGPSAIESIPPVGALKRWHLRLGIAVLGVAICLTGVTTSIFWTSGYHWFDKAVAPIPRLSIVVLPFKDLSESRDQTYLADGITGDLTTDLSRIAGSFVISSNTAATYKSKSVDAKQIGRELGVRYVLEGGVRRSGNQVRVNVQLINAETNAHLFAERFDSETADIFALQNEITARIANTLGFELDRAEAARQTSDPDARDYLFRGRAAISKGPTRENYTAAISLYERSLSLDPSSVGAQVSLAQILISRVLEVMTYTPGADTARAEELINQALASSPRNQTAHFTKGQLLRSQGRCEEASTEYETVLALNRNSAAALVNLGRCKYLTGSLGEAIPLMEQAIRLSPRDPFIGSWYSSIGMVHLLQSRKDEAILWLERARIADPERPVPHAGLASAYALKGETDRAAAELAEARKLSGNNEYSSIARLNARWGVPKIRALQEATYFAGLRRAGMPEE